MVVQIAEYKDDRGNSIVWVGDPIPNTRITFSGSGSGPGSGNRLIVDDDARIGGLPVQFDCDNGLMEVGSSRGVPALSETVRVDQDSPVFIGRNVSTAGAVGISAIFDVTSGARVSVSRDIIIGDHVWIGYNAAVLGGVTIGDGAAVGLGSVVTKDIPNNSVAAGNPARVVPTDIAWERPHLSLTKPYYQPDASTIEESC